jgi:hypothetical protein
MNNLMNGETMRDEKLTPEEKRKQQEDLAIAISLYLDAQVHDETDTAWFKLSDALAALEKELGEKAGTIMWKRV